MWFNSKWVTHLDQLNQSAHPKRKKKEYKWTKNTIISKVVTFPFKIAWGRKDNCEGCSHSSQSLLSNLCLHKVHFDGIRQHSCVKPFAKKYLHKQTAKIFAMNLHPIWNHERKLRVSIDFAEISKTGAILAYIGAIYGAIWSKFIPNPPPTLWTSC